MGDIGEIIYNGHDIGLFCSGIFKKFMGNFKGADLIIGDGRGPGDEGSRFCVYHISPQNVALRYFCEDGSAGSSLRATVKLWGDKESKSGIKKIIFEEADKYS